jgi:23S rRNA (uracil1939-C5)-methyltransferase
VPAGVTVVGDDELTAGHRAWFHEDVAGRRLRVSARSFFQARPDGADALVDAVRAALAGAPDGRLVDAYGGVGLFGATVSADRPVTLVEWSASSVADARVNLPDARVLRLDVAKWRPSPAAAVVADPARTGLGKAAADVLAGTGASHLVLVSCDPASLGRDAGLLAGHGFVHDGTQVVDLFPHTPHVEAVTRFIR